MTSPPEAPKTSKLVVLSGPSGVGKSTVVTWLRARNPSVWVSVSVTTRAARIGEVDGVTYHFVSAERFAEMSERGELLEFAEFAGNYYGTPAQPVRDRLAAGEQVLLEIELEGARQVRTAMPDAMLVFLQPPSWEALTARLVGRGTEPPHVIAARLRRARVEMAAAEEFDVVLINDNVERVGEALNSLLHDALG